jgi:hypothetical protein
MVERQAERQENELGAEARLRWGPGTALGSYPVREAGEQGAWQELGFRLEPPRELVLQLEVEFGIQERLRAGRGVSIEGVDEDMVLAFWAVDPEMEGSGEVGEIV